MNTLLSLVLVIVSSSIVFAKSQRNCSTSDDCEKDGCCFNGICSYKSSYKCIHQNCSSNSDCYLSTESCCVNKKCQACRNEHSDNYEESEGGRAGSGSSGGSSTGVVLVLLIVIPLKIAFCISCCWCRLKLRSEQYVIRRRPRRSVRDERGTAAPLVANDELQRELEHAQAEQIENRRPRPPYNPETDHHENTTQDTEQNNLSFIINPIENSNMEPIRGAQGTGDTDEMNGAPQFEQWFHHMTTPILQSIFLQSIFLQTPPTKTQPKEN
ncbi:uncharacterized protein LOC114517130 isoform X4 [Dendronephthya gigantea]|uniref:uncharacterized protein LOC114517130 isoform X4 n=1 Tax=Dendronephthya gigantea TaxID=151771 RepID=UPI00106A03E4|nr:uncharacterized protein LOC114517130 isoform X4 [Dendronephthya gigantea]